MSEKEISVRTLILHKRECTDTDGHPHIVNEVSVCSDDLRSVIDHSRSYIYRNVKVCDFRPKISNTVTWFRALISLFQIYV